MKNKWINRPDIDPNFDPKEVVEDLYKHYTYEELLENSKPIDDVNLKKLEKWKQFHISTFDNYEKIFYDIANSKKAKWIYIKTNIVSIIFCFIKILPMIYTIFVSCGIIISRNRDFIFKPSTWEWMLCPMMGCFVIDFLIGEMFKNYLPTNWTGKIDTSYKGNKTNFDEPKNLWFNSIPKKIFFWFQIKKPVFKCKYNNYIAINGNKYLIEKNMEGRYYSMRNWYLISKYITLGKMSIAELDNHFQDELFVYLTTDNHKEEKIKLKCFFNKKFSLYFMFDYNAWLTIIYFVLSLYSGIFLNVCHWMFD